MLPQEEDRVAPGGGPVDGSRWLFRVLLLFFKCNPARLLFTENKFPMGNTHICPQCEHIKDMLK